MKMSRYSLLISTALLLGSACAQAAPSADAGACANEPTASRAPCLREIGAAAQAARAGQLTSESAADYERNALARCSVFKDAQDKSDCEKRMGPQARVSGSVSGGGLLREETDTYTVRR